MTAIQYMFDFSSRVFLLPQDLDQLFSGEIASLEYWQLFYIIIAPLAVSRMFPMDIITLVYLESCPSIRQVILSCLLLVGGIPATISDIRR